MAELILSPIADKIIGSLASLAVQEIATLWGVKEELEGLESTISLISGVLLDAEEKQVHNHGVRIWLKSLADAVHEAGDLMDEFDTEDLRRRVMPGNGFAKQVRTFFSSSNQLAFRHKMGQKIKEIRNKLAAASSDRSFLLLEVRSPDKERHAAQKRETHSFVRQDEVIGRDEDREAIVKLLLESQFEKNVSVIPIIGIGGLGKTTLVQSVFNHESVQQHFELKAWVCVSDPFDLKVIVQTITKSKEVELDQLQLDLRKMLRGKRYLLVLDDVWEENHENWLKLKTLLIDGAEGSRVVVTTRSRAVAKVTSPIEPYQLGVLDEQKSWSLFKKMAFRQELEKENSNLVVIGKEIVKRCGGIPLAIRTIGSTLHNKYSETEWSSFNKEFSKLPQGDHDILPTLKLSYDNLTSHLKQCFVYCRLFPKDHYINVQTLIQLWMAQGFVKLSDPSHDQCLEDVGYGYFVDLSERSFFQEIKIDEFGVAQSCKMHDLIHDLAIELAGEGYDNMNLNSEKALNKNVRHVSLSCYDVNLAKPMLTSFLQARKIRTVLVLADGSNDLKPISSPIILNLNQIRTLGLNSLGNTIEPNSIHRLKFVRYLDFSRTKSIKTLPKSITTLLNLQTLKLNYCSNLQELPRGLKKLVNLRHLEIFHCFELRHMPVGLGQLTNLTTLTTYVLPESSGCASRHCGELKELMALSNLRGELEITNLRHEEEAATKSKSANLKEKQHLESLYLSWDSNANVTEGNITGYEMSLEGLQPHPNLKRLSLNRYRGVKFSSWLQSLTNLVSLALSSCENCKHLDPVLSQSNNLKVLELTYLPSLEYIINSYNDNNLLTSLQKLELRDLPSLKGWWGEYVVSEEENQHKPLPSFSQLTQLSIANCPNLSHLPLFPHLEGNLVLSNASLKPFQQTVLETYSFSPLSKLETLVIDKIGDLECLPDCFKSLTSLPCLEIKDCPRLKDLCPGILYLTSLKELMIGHCEELVDKMHNAIMWKALNGRLQSLTLYGFREMESLPEGIQHVTSLQYLDLSNCGGLKTIPEWIGNLRSLTNLSCWYCPNLTSLPEGIRSLTSLEELKIEDCPILLKRCQREIGEDWPKIAHISCLDLYPDPNEDDGSGSEAAQKK